jgi:hypothetical protein
MFADRIFKEKSITFSFKIKLLTTRWCFKVDATQESAFEMTIHLLLLATKEQQGAG